MLTELLQRLRERGVSLALAQAKGQVRDRMRRTGLMDALGEDHVFLSVGGAVAVLGSTIDQPGPEPPGPLSPGPAEPAPA
jgi:SulP family sulfate permease